MEVTILNPEGVHESEKDAISELRASLPNSWKGYASLELIDRAQGPSEMDLVVVTADRLIIVELKNWNGPLFARDGHWFVFDDDRGRSPVDVTANKSRKLAGRIRKKLDGKLKRIPWVDYCVVLCGTSDKSNLPEDQAAFVVSLEDFKKAGTPTVYDNLFPKKLHFKDKSLRPNQHIDLWDRFFTGNSADFKPREYSFNNYAISGQPLLKHPNSIYSEYFAYRRDNKNYKALMRRWNFNSPEIIESAQTMEERRLIGFRESDVLGYIDSQDEDLKGIHLSLLHIPSPEEITAEFCELYEWPSNRLRLDEFMNKNRSSLDARARLELIQVLLSQVSRLHDIDVAHRDIGKHSIWLALPSRVTLSNFVTASFPDPSNKTVVSVRKLLSASNAEIPEDQLNDPDGTQYTRDVYLLAAAAHYIAYDRWPKKVDGIYIWEKIEDDKYDSVLDEWFETALEMDPASRYPNLNVALESFNELSKRALTESTYDESILGSHLSRVNVWTDYQSVTVSTSGTEMLLRSSDSRYGIKLWNGISQLLPNKSVNQRLLSFLHRAQQLKNGSLSCLPGIKEFGYNPEMQALFVVYEWVDGETWKNWMESITEGALVDNVCVGLLSTLTELEKFGHHHGDIHPGNVILSRDQDSDALDPMYIDFFNLASADEPPYCRNYVPDNYLSLPIEGRDRFAVVKMISEAADRASSLKLYLRCSHLLNQPEISSGDINRLIDEITSNLEQKDTEVEAEWVVSAARVPEQYLSTLNSDDGSYYIQVKPANLESKDPVMRIYISGMTTQLDIFVDPTNGSIKRLHVKDITHAQFIRNKKGAEIVLNGVIKLEQGLADRAISLLEAIVDSPAVRELEQENDTSKSKYLEVMQADGGASISASDIWSALAQTEEETYPHVTVMHQSERRSNGRVGVQYSIENQVLDFDLKVDTVNVQQWRRTEYRTVGVLDSYDRKFLIVTPTRSDFNASPGDTLRLESSLNASSLLKRRTAVENLAKNRSVISSLPSFFSTNIEVAPICFNDEPSDADLDFYTERNEDGDITFALNENQRQAFRSLYSKGPVGLLQGPPGTGKTSFISSFIHYALENGAQNVLLVSQSHEAVNNAAERVTSLFSKHDKAVGVVRLGNEGQVSKGLEGAHELAIQDHYRERFRAEYSQRLAALAPALGLEDDFVNLCIDFENGYAKHIERMLATDSVEGDEETADISLARFSRLQRRLNEFFGRAQLNLEVTSFPQLNGIRDEFYSAAIEKYGVASYDSVERLKQISSLANEWLKVMSSSRANFQNFLVRTRNLVCGTCVGVGRAHYGITDNIYDWVVIDEAARSNAGELAIAMQVGRRILLVGDHKQLPPMYEESHIDSAHKRLPGISSGEIRKSDFERGFVSSYGKSIGQTLLHQYRMAPPIGTLVSKCFYDSLLATDRGEADIAFSNFPFESNSCVTWIDTSDLGKGGFEQQSGQGGDTSTTYVNQSEIRCIVNLLRTILVDEALLRRLEEDSVHEPPIGIICMYSGQKQALVKRMNSIPWGRDFIENGIVKIDTVDGYQGKENDVVIVSLVRNNRGGNQGFLSSPERINVALSRAKERLFIVGATSMWSSATKSPLGAVYQHISSSGDGTAYTILSADKLPRMGE